MDMIDSSGRSAIKANGTILDLLPVGNALLLSGGLLVVLFTLVKPEASNGLSFAGRLLFWAVHVGLGLIAIWLASLWLGTREYLPGGTLLAILVTGCAGALVATIGYLILDQIYAPYIIDLDPDPPYSSLPKMLITEIAELSPWFLASWVLINLPVLLPRPSQSVTLDDSVRHTENSSGLKVESIAEHVNDIVIDTTSDPKTTAKESDTTTSHTPDTSASINGLKKNHSLNGHNSKFLINLPGVVGTDVIAISSDLHYLNVWTVAGRTTILGNLRDAVAELDDIGMQVHRSHWVAHAHVKRIVGTASDAACILSNELRIPISRRKWKSVREHYGRGFVNTEPL